MREGDVAGPDTYDRDGNPIDRDEAMPAWTKVARPILEDVARIYNGKITYGELATKVQEETGIFTKQLVHYWAGPVAFSCSLPDEPLLSSLVMNGQGLVGDGYKSAVVSTYGEPAPEDLQMHSAEERLKCYQFFQAKGLPADGGRATLTPQVARQRLRAAAVAKALVVKPTCPVHHLELPLTGQCDLCAEER
jgi:hypothetical protein